MVFSFMGMATEEKVVDGQTSLNITLKEDHHALDEVLVRGVQKL